MLAERTPDPYAWDVIAQIADLLRDVAEAAGGAVQTAFELAEDALAERAQEGPCPAV